MKFEIAINSNVLDVHQELAAILFRLFYPSFGLGEVWGDQKLIAFDIVSKQHDPNTICKFITLWGVLRGVDVSCAHVKESEDV